MYEMAAHRPAFKAFVRISAFSQIIFKFWFEWFHGFFASSKTCLALKFHKCIWCLNYKHWSFFNKWLIWHWITVFRIWQGSLAKLIAHPLVPCHLAILHPCKSKKYSLIKFIAFWYDVVQNQISLEFIYFDKQTKLSLKRMI